MTWTVYGQRGGTVVQVSAPDEDEAIEQMYLLSDDGFEAGCWPTDVEDVDTKGKL